MKLALIIFFLSFSAVHATPPPSNNFEDLLKISKLGNSKDVDNLKISIKAYVNNVDEPCFCPPNAACEKCVAHFQISENANEVSKTRLLTILPTNEYTYSGKATKTESFYEGNKLKVRINETADSAKPGKVIEITPGKKYEFLLVHYMQFYELVDVKPVE